MGSMKGFISTAYHCTEGAAEGTVKMVGFLMKKEGVE
jgi:hypothetical protein